MDAGAPHKARRLADCLWLHGIAAWACKASAVCLGFLMCQAFWLPSSYLGRILPWQQNKLAHLQNKSLPIWTVGTVELPPSKANASG